ncbi:hypothetical protein [Acetobacter sp. P1H12_c]|uniref:hypothetical protein n=1 Tax=Acetobacter sp. P1H12_c TaxID=2762621 RepID=UPI001C043384|nr:hypothetical protein [Acetobacter sp. P1H12_c]
MINPSTSVRLLNAANTHKSGANQVPEMSHDVIVKIFNGVSWVQRFKIWIGCFGCKLKHLSGKIFAYFCHRVSSLFGLCSHKVDGVMRVWQCGQTASLPRMIGGVA